MVAWSSPLLGRVGASVGQYASVSSLSEPIQPPTPARRSAEVTLADGTRLLIRPITPDDKDALRRGFERMSPDSRYRRFFAPMTRLSTAMLRALTEVDYYNQFAWVALACEDEQTELVGVARYIRLPDPATAEVAVAVIDPYHGRGIGTLLLDALVPEALQAGIRRFEGSILSDNHAMRAVLASTDARFFRDEERGATAFHIDLPERAEELRGHAVVDLLRRLARGEADLYHAEPCPWVTR